MLSQRNSFLLIFVLRKSILDLLVNDFATQHASQTAKLLFKATKKINTESSVLFNFSRENYPRNFYADVAS